MDRRPEQADPLAAPPPDVGAEEAAELAERLFGVTGSLVSLDSERDRNFRIDAADGGRFVLKVHNPADAPSVVDMQTRAMLHIARTDPELRVQRMERTLDGALHAELERPDGARHVVRLLTHLEGRASVEPSELSLDALRDYGGVAARVGRALRGFFHPAADQVILWDIKRAASLRPLVGHVEDRARRALVDRTLDRFEERVLPALGALRAQVVHDDLTLDNVLLDDDGRVTGIVDFGDMAHTPLVCDLAVALGSLLRERENLFETADAAIGGYTSVTPLEDAEAALLADLLATRAAATLVISAWRVRRYPDNTEYITGWDAGSLGILEALWETGPAEVERRFRRSCALVAANPPRPGPSRIPQRELLERRRAALGPALAPLSYDRPVHLVRGEGAWMFDLDGRGYLDCYNNVPVVGHCHQRVTEAIAEQAQTLNTNTRYLHETIVELAERLTATMPEGLDTCMFVNSGSEANDLAWRIATTVTGASGGIVTARAYHGVTAAINDLSPEEWPAGKRPGHVETLPAPDGYRGPYRSEEPGWAERYAAHADEVLETLARRGHRPAALLVDPAFTSDGIFDPPPAYLREVVRRVREVGGLFVADEVQAGFARTGSQMWSFEASGVAPDMVTLGKPMGNGHPVAALVTRRDIAEAFARETDFFSTYGGNPVACAAALAVLEVIEEEDLQRRAAEVGAHLRAGLEGLAALHPLIGDVRGLGLLLGVELVRDRGNREPAAAETDAAMNGLRDRGVLVGSTGRDANVLKIRPPLVLDRDEADLLIARLDKVLFAVAR
jgi:4-aminobutyrate aminotransferase-like enzyme/Ser/Thr protein kinase RdoA (MazF antagonist)